VHDNNFVLLLPPHDAAQVALLSHVVVGDVAWVGPATHRESTHNKLIVTFIIDEINGSHLSSLSPLFFVFSPTILPHLHYEVIADRGHLGAATPVLHLRPTKPRVVI
jgi:hypothetical protein